MLISHTSAVRSCALATSWLACRRLLHAWSNWIRETPTTRASVQQVNETDWLTRARDSRWAEASKTQSPSFVSSSIEVIKYFQTMSRVNFKQKSNVSKTFCPHHHSLMMETGKVAETLDFCSELSLLIAWEDFVTQNGAAVLRSAHSNLFVDLYFTFPIFNNPFIHSCVCYRV
jgi:hypothetical protein